MSINKSYILNFKDQSLYFNNLRSLSEHLVFCDVYHEEFSVDEIRENELVNLTKDIFNNKYFINYLKTKKEILESNLYVKNGNIEDYKNDIENLEEEIKEIEDDLNYINDLLNKVENIDGDIDEMQQEIDNANYILNG